MSYNQFNIPERPLDPPEPVLRKAFTCQLCDESIYEGEDYYMIPGVGPCCETCIDDCRRYDAEAGPDPDEAYERSVDRELMREED